MGLDASTLDRFLEDLCARIDPAEERANLQGWMDFVEGRCREGFFTPPARTPRPEKATWPSLHVNDAQEDFDTMILHQFKMISDVLARGGGDRLNVRCNYGTGILPTQFGCELYVMARETNTLPTAIPLHSADRIRALVDAGAPDVRAGLGAKVFDCAERFQEVFRRYPVLAEHVKLYHPDLQGPIDVAEVVWGSEIFLAFYDEPDLVRSFLDLVTETYARFARAWFSIVPPDGPYSTHYSWLHKGRLVLREDSLMNLSPETYVEFIRPMDQRLLKEFDGGGVHYCGRGDHFVPALVEMDGLYFVNLSQPHLNDMETIFRHTVDRGIPLYALDRGAAEKAVAQGRNLHGKVYCP
jgi:hypothetical protein